ncbi:hypothetical protein VZT92_023923 [Zoarces viviparus]|uniref:Uncharacterized protein n=1 Tax=Zoarces viviparus TaxID=48416 RepID=A0AAW1E845_ZOAVI
MFAVFGTPEGGKTGTRDLVRSGPCAPQTDSRACRYIHRANNTRPFALCSLPADGSVAQVSNPQQEDGGATEECVGAKYTHRRGSL